MTERYLRRVIRLGDSAAITLPPKIAERFRKSAFVWLEDRAGEVVIREARVD